MTLVQLILGFLVLGSSHTGRLVFQKNQGQAPADVRYIVETPGYRLHFKHGEMVFYFGHNALRIEFAGPLANHVPSGSGRLDRIVRYVDSDNIHDTNGIAMFAAVKYESLYSGVDLSCYGHNSVLQCDFVARPGADPAQIRLDVEGADHIEIDEAGNLILEVAGQPLRIQKPNALQVEHGQRKPVEARYQITGSHEIGLVVSSYDHSIPLIINSH